MNKIVMKAPCKVNLTLDIAGRLPNGYHEMDMIMQSVGLCDMLEICKTDAEGIVLDCSKAGVPCDDSNIVVRCANAFFEYTGITPAVHFHLEKHIPAMAGLGGGSADGAAALAGLDALYETHLSREVLCQLGFSCGADIPFCICGGTRRVQGAGEILKEVSLFPQDLWFVIAKPYFSVNTGLAFRQFDEQEHPLRGDIAGMLEALEKQDPVQIGQRLTNVFEPFSRPQEIGGIKKVMLDAGALGALMSGSGSAVFGIFKTEKEAQNCRDLLEPSVEQADVARPVTGGPWITEQK